MLMFVFYFTRITQTFANSKIPASPEISSRHFADVPIHVTICPEAIGDLVIHFQLHLVIKRCPNCEYLNFSVNTTRSLVAPNVALRCHGFGCLWGVLLSQTARLTVDSFVRCGSKYITDVSRHLPKRA